VLIYARVVSLLLLVGITVISPTTAVTVAAIGSILCILAIQLRIKPVEFARRNIFIIVFTIIFSSFALISGYLNDKIEYAQIAANAVKILLIFNIVYIGSLWSGKNGFLCLLNAMPLLRIKVFLLILHNMVLSFIKRSGLILYQLRSRLDLSRQRGLVARYYVQNLLMKELYSIHLNQASIITRLHSDFDIYCMPEKMKISDGIAFVILLFLLLNVVAPNTLIGMCP